MRAIVATALVTLALAGCASSPTTGQPTPSASPTFVCENVVGTEPIGTCPPPTSEAVHPENEAYRDRYELDESQLAAVSAHLPQVQAALEPLSLAETPPTAATVERALMDAGFAASDVQVADGTFVGFGVWTGEGCVFGGVGTNRLEVEAGGPIRDGGCLPAVGH